MTIEDLLLLDRQLDDIMSMQTRIMRAFSILIDACLKSEDPRILDALEQIRGMLAQEPAI